MRKTRAALYEALLALLGEKPFEQVSIREVAARAGIGYATFFRHYESKEALLHDLAADEVRRLIELTEPAFNAVDTRAAAETVCAHVDEQKQLWSALLTGGAAGVMREEFVRQARQIKTRSPRRGAWLPPDLAIIYGVSATVEILTWWLRQKRGVTVKRIAEILDRLVVAPLGGPSGTRT